VTNRSLPYGVCWVVGAGLSLRLMRITAGSALMIAAAACTSAQQASHAARQVPAAAPAPTVTFTHIDNRMTSAVTWTRAGQHVTGTVSLRCLQGCKGVSAYSSYFTGRINGKAVDVTLSTPLRHRTDAHGGLHFHGKSLGLRLPGISLGDGFWLVATRHPDAFARNVAKLTGPGGFQGYRIRAALAKRSVHHFDVDGDGHSDRVTLRWTRISRLDVGRGTVEVTVRFAKGGSAHRRLQVPSWTSLASDTVSLPLVRAANLDGVGGRDLVIGVDNSPASFDDFDVVAARDHQLMRLPAPVRLGWFVGASVGSGGEGFSCTHGLLTASSSGPVHLHHDREIYRTVRKTFRWFDSRWNMLRTQVSRGRHEAGYWSCPGLGNSF
jgi:hypothetical protein